MPNNIIDIFIQGLNGTISENNIASYDDLSYHCHELVVNVGRILISGDYALFAFLGILIAISVLIVVIFIISVLQFIISFLFCILS